MASPAKKETPIQSIHIEGMTREQLGTAYTGYSVAIGKLTPLTLAHAIPGDASQDLTAQFAAVEKEIATALKSATITDAAAMARSIVESYKNVKAPEYIAQIRGQVPEENRKEFDELTREGLRTAIYNATPGAQQKFSGVFFEKNQKGLHKLLDKAGMSDAQTIAENIAAAYKNAVGYEEKRTGRLI